MPRSVTYDFSKQVIIITGSTKGIGRGIAEQFVRAGACVTVNSRDPSAVETTVDELSEISRNSVIGVSGDVSDPATCEQLVDDPVDEFGKVDVLVNNAAIWPPGPMHKVGLDEWDFALDVNAKAPYYLSILAIDHFLGREEPGNIVNISSRAGERTAGGHGLYGVSKAAQNGLTWRLAHDVAPHGIRVNAVSTAITDSSQIRRNWTEGDPAQLSDEEIALEKERIGERVPLGRIGHPEDIANGVLFLASDAASYITGHILRVSGGRNLV